LQDFREASVDNVTIGTLIGMGGATLVIRLTSGLPAGFLL